MTSERTAAALERLQKAFSRLRPIERDVLALSAGERLSNEQISRRLGIGVRRVERLLASALRKFDRLLD